MSRSVLVAAVLVAVILIPRAALEAKASGREATDREGPVTVIVELFTSQGCSSCPPADRLLAKIGGRTKAAGRQIEVVPLAFHVDYWDNIGWPDPFAAPEWTERQRAYARYFRDGRIYTPQLVAAGGRHCVGSNRDRVEALIGWAATQKPSVHLEAVVAAETGMLVVEIDAQVVAPLGAARPLVMVAVYDSGHVTEVERGENASRSLRNERVVRRLESILTIDPEQAGPQQAFFRVATDPSWRRDDLGVAVFAQDPNTGAILGATSAVVPAAPKSSSPIAGGAR
jgi:hypothetical protein